MLARTLGQAIAIGPALIVLQLQVLSLKQAAEERIETSAEHRPAGGGYGLLIASPTLSPELPR